MKNTMRSLVLGLLFALITTGCSLMQNEAWVEISSNSYRDYTCVVNGSRKYIGSYSTTTWTIEWEGAGGEEVDITVTDGGTLVFSQTITIEDGETRSVSD